MTRGVAVALVSGATYLAVGWPTIGEGEWANVAIRLVMLVGTAIGVGILAQVEEAERLAVTTLTGQAQVREQFIRSVVESLSEGLVALDLEGRVVAWNRVMEERHGLASAGSLGANLSRHLPELPARERRGAARATAARRGGRLHPRRRRARHAPARPGGPEHEGQPPAPGRPARRRRPAHPGHHRARGLRALGAPVRSSPASAPSPPASRTRSTIRSGSSPRAIEIMLLDAESAPLPAGGDGGPRACSTATPSASPASLQGLLVLLAPGAGGRDAGLRGPQYARRGHALPRREADGQGWDCGEAGTRSRPAAHLGRRECAPAGADEPPDQCA